MVVLGILGVLAALLVSHKLGRAVPTNNYRPVLPADALATGCFPLPGGADLDLAYQIRSDQDVRTSHGSRRQLRGQYDLVDRDEAERRIQRCEGASPHHGGRRRCWDAST